MARKDVDLVIRARDEAAKVVDSITAAINDFVESQNELQKNAGKTTSVLGALGAALGGLDKELKGLNAADKIAQEFDRAQAAAKRLNAEFEDTRKAASDLARDLQRAEFVTDNLTKKAQGAAQAQAKASAALDKARASQAALTAALRDATAERDKLVRQEARINESGMKQAQRVADVTARYERLKQEIASVANPTKGLQTRFEAANQSLQKQTAKLDELKTKYAATQAGIASAGQTIANLTGKLETVNAAVARQEGVVGKISTNYRELGAAAKTAAKNQKEIESASDRTADALARQESRIERSKTELAQLGAAAGKADAAMSELANRSGAAMQRSFDQQRRTMLEAKREWLGLTDATGKMAAEIGRVGVPTKEMLDNFNRSKIAAAGAKQEYLAQRDGLHALAGVLRQSGSDLDSLRSKQQQFSQVQTQTGAAIAGIRQRTREAGAEYTKLNGAAGQAEGSIRRVGDSAKRTATNTGQASAATNKLSDAYRKLYGESRMAMSWTQRLRGEVLSLITAYAGLQGVIGLLKQTVAAYQTLEAVSTRLNAALGGNTEAAAQELDWIRRNADRLGISMATLGDEYSKFAVAARAANFQGQATRKVFNSVAEAARVNKLSMEQMSGVFLALQQMISKGKIQSEELRRQLGDRLPGAFNIMADALGVTTAELDDMMKKGQVIADEGTLLKFAAELDKRFGGTLAASLQTTTTAFGKFQNAAFQALVTFGKAGFIESFTDLLNDLTAMLKSADFQAFAAKFSVAFGTLIDVIALAVRNFDLLVIAASAFAGIKLTPLIVALVSQFGTLATRVQRVGTIMGATRNAMVASTSATVATTRAVQGLTLAFRTLLSATGIGLAVTAISVAIGWWATRADEASESLNRHRDLVDKVKNAYDLANGSSEKFAEALSGTTLSQAQENLRKVKEALIDIRNEADRYINTWAKMKAHASAFNVFTGSVGARSQYEEIERLSTQFAKGKLKAEDYKKALDGIARQAKTDSLRQWALELQEIADRAGDAEKAVGEAEKIVTVYGESATDAAKAAKELAGGFEDTADKTVEAAAKAKEFTDALAEINDIAKETGKSLDDLKDKAKLDEAFQSAVKAAESLQQLTAAVNGYDEALTRLYQQQADKDFGRFTDGMEASATLIRQREGFRSTPYWDKNAYRIGYGSDTVTLADGSIQKVVQGMRISVADANRDLVRRVGEFQSVVKGQIGSERFGALTAQQQAALTSIAYNYGSLPERIVKAFKTGGDEQIAAAIRALGSDNGGINRERRMQEAALYSSTAGYEAQAQQQQADAKKLADEAERRAKAAQDFHDQQTASTEQAQFELSIQDQELVKREQAKAIREAELAAQKAGTELTEKERQNILANVEAKFRQQQIDEQNKATKEKAAEAEERVNQLLQQRQALEQQLAMYKEAGDTGKVTETEQAIANVNAQLKEAIANAIAMWQAVGGGLADTSIAKLQTAAMEAAKFGQQAKTAYIDWKRVGELFASGLTNAFDQFAQAVANGEDVGEAARKAFLQFAADFLRQIAQMIIQQAILNALRSFAPGLFGGLGVGVGHTGGLVGSSRVGAGNSSRKVNPGIFAAAARYHTGGIAGLRPNEVPLIAKKGEEIITEDDPRHMLNGGGATGEPQRMPDWKIINAIDAGSFIDAGLNSKVGERSFLNYIRANAGAIKAALG